MTAAARQVGLVVNPGKCELVACGGDRAAVDVSLFPHHLPLNTAGAFALLGAPIGPAAFWQPAHSQSRVASAKPLLQALAALPDARTSLLLLRQCAAFCKVAYAAWVTPTSATADALLAFDGEVLKCLEAACTGPLQDTCLATNWPFHFGWWAWAAACSCSRRCSLFRFHRRHYRSMYGFGCWLCECGCCRC